MTKQSRDNLLKLSNEQLVKIIEDYYHAFFDISEILVDESKGHTSSEVAVKAIRGCFGEVDGYKLYDETLGHYIDFKLGKISRKEYWHAVLGR